MKSAVIVFPGSNCDRDCVTALRHSSGVKADLIWHTQASLDNDIDLIVLPGGFSYGDYLRCGAMAALSPVMQEVIRLAKRGVTVLGICNGFQILCETGLLPGTFLRNKNLKYICKPTSLKLCRKDSRFSSAFATIDQEIIMPVGNGDGHYFAEQKDLDLIEKDHLVLFRYLDNPNGSVNDIAGLTNKTGNVLGLMPHPDRAFERDIGGDDGAKLFQSIAQFYETQKIRT